MIVEQFNYRCPSGGNAVDTATGYGMDDRRGRSSTSGRLKNFYFSSSSKSVLGSA
jgi:hypothetical protein